jgi:muramoyltetrapeptide carboxypeptidase
MADRGRRNADSPIDGSTAVHKPARLKPGARIGVVAPAGAVDAGLLSAGVRAIEAEGFQVELARGIHRSKGYLAGDEKSRARDLLDFFHRPDIDAIFCARGGFGSIQLLPHLTSELARHPKIFVGYSDITVLINWLRQSCSMVTFHAPMVAMDIARGLDSRSRMHFWEVLSGERRRWQLFLGEAIRPGKVRAEMMGGCLSLLVTTLGTPYEIDTRGRILFLEDIGEKPYRIERMLTHLKMAGKLDAVAGVVFGDFVDCHGEGPRGVRQVIVELFGGAGYPVVLGLAAGHGEENLALPFGVAMTLSGDDRTLTLEETPVL